MEAISLPFRPLKRKTLTHFLLQIFCFVSISLRIFRLSELPDAEACLVGAGDGGDKHEVDVGHVAAAHRVYELLHRRHLVESQISTQRCGVVSLIEARVQFRFLRILYHGETTRKRQRLARKKEMVLFDINEIF
jgi:hypothetical protein